jgi:hypothetical protein
LGGNVGQGSKDEEQEANVEDVEDVLRIRDIVCWVCRCAHAHFMKTNSTTEGFRVSGLGQLEWIFKQAPFPPPPDF